MIKVMGPHSELSVSFIYLYNLLLYNLLLYNLYFLLIYLNCGCGGRSLLYSLSLVAVLELPLVVASLVAEQGL